MTKFITGVKIATGTIVDGTIIRAPSSTSNAQRGRDPEKHQVKKGQQWCVGVKAHVGVDSKSGTVHTAVATAANTPDSKVLPVWDDGTYQGQGEAMREVASDGAGHDLQTDQIQAWRG
jgi:transposase, IS5 family